MANEVKISYGNELLRTSTESETVTLKTTNRTLTSDVSVEVSIESKRLVKSDVNFYDYDGTLIDSYNNVEFASLSALPANPTHSGLTAQGWNWTLADAKVYVADCGKLDIGQIYTTSDGKTRLYVTLESPRLHPYVGFGINGTATIDWGDNSATSTVTGSAVDTVVYGDHTYASAGSYVITIEGNINILGASNCTHLMRKINTGNPSTADAVYASCIRKIEIGNIYGIDSYAFNRCKSLETLLIPNGITDIGYQAFQYCYNLSRVTFPNGVTSLGSAAFYYCQGIEAILLSKGITSVIENTFNFCYALKSINIPSGVLTINAYAFQECYSIESITLPSGVTTIGQYAFTQCRGLRTINIPSSVTSIGQQAFNNCYALESITIPEGVTSIGASTFSYCKALKSVTLPSTVTSIGANAFDYCASLQSITLSETFTSIGNYAFRECSSLESINLPNSITSLGQYAFQNCTSLRSVNIPNKLTSISTYTFSGCSNFITLTIPDKISSIYASAFSGGNGLGEIHFLPTTPPTLSGSSVFSSLQTDCTIYVPTGKLSAYTSKTNYPSSSTYTYVEE